MQFNQKLHSSKLYNGFQFTVSALAVFSGSTYNSMKKHQETLTCFVAGTMILTASGLVAIENIKAGDKVISTNPETFETAEKTVLETYIREDSKLIHLVINGEEVVTTESHPFYVKDKGFINAGELDVGDELLDSSCNVLLLESLKIELTSNPTLVYNFQVEDFHTYHVGENCVLVHNADYDVDIVSKNIKERISNDELNPPTKRGNAPTSKKDGKPIEIHHDNQNPNGPFYEKTQTDHRLGGNYKKNHPHYNEGSKINRAQWRQQKKNYWKNEWDSGRWK